MTYIALPWLPASLAGSLKIRLFAEHVRVFSCFLQSQDNCAVEASQRSRFPVMDLN
jgi:hypothetical protein